MTNSADGSSPPKLSMHWVIEMDDRVQTDREQTAPRVAIISGRTLQRYTTGILAHGFSEIGWDVVPSGDSRNLLFQVHGAPHSLQDDCDVLERFSANGGKAEISSRIVLIHRPDEVHNYIPDILDRVHRAPSPKSIVLLGDLLLESSLFQGTDCAIEVIPHGFFSSSIPVSPFGKSVVGSHTTWGEMRLFEHGVELVGKTLAFSSPGSIIGYLGGEPRSLVSEDRVRKLLRELDIDDSIEVVPSYDQVQQREKKKVLVVRPGPVEDPSIQPTFNVQLFVLGGRLRLGESSGSLHVRSCIPVVFEVNGAERVEELNIVRVPYEAPENLRGIDMDSAAAEIVELVNSGAHDVMLANNVNSARRFSPRYVADRYADVFRRLSEVRA